MGVKLYKIIFGKLSRTYLGDISPKNIQEKILLSNDHFLHLFHNYPIWHYHNAKKSHFILSAVMGKSAVMRI